MKLSVAVLLFVVLAFVRGDDDDDDEYNSIPDTADYDAMGGLDFENLISSIFGDGPGGNGPGNGGPTGPDGDGTGGNGPFGPGGNGTPINNLLSELLGGGPLGPGELFGEGPDMGPVEDLLGDMTPPHFPGPMMSMMGQDLESPPPFRLPSYVLTEMPSRVLYDKINFTEIRPIVEGVIRNALDTGVPLTELVRTIAPKLFKLKSGCPINAMQRLISAGLTTWANKGMDKIGEHMAMYAQGEDVQPLVNAIKEEVMTEINRTVFGSEFDEFDEVLKFVQTAVNLGMKAAAVTGTGNNTTRDPTPIVFPILRYVLQCKSRPAFLQELITRISVLKHRILWADPWTFNARVLRRLPMPCGDFGELLGPEILSKIFQGTTYALKTIKRELRRMIFMVERAIIFGDDQGIVKIFPEFLGNQTSMLAEILGRIRSEGPSPPAPPPFPTDLDDVPTTDFPSPSNLPPSDTPPSSPPLSPPPTTGPPPPEKRVKSRRPPFSPPPPSTPLTSPPPPPTTGPPPPERRSESTASQKYKAKVLDLILKRLLAKEKRDLPR